MRVSRLPISLFRFCNDLLRTLLKTVCCVCNRIVFHSNVTRTSKCWEKLTWNVTLCWVETSFSCIPFFPRGINCYKYSKCQFLIQLCITILINFFLFFSPMGKIRLEWSPSFSILSLATVATAYWPQNCSTLFISCS